MAVSIKFNSLSNSWALIDGDREIPITKSINSHGVKTWILPSNSANRNYLADPKMRDGLILEYKEKNSDTERKQKTEKTEINIESYEKYLGDDDKITWRRLCSVIRDHQADEAKQNRIAELEKLLRELKGE